MAQNNHVEISKAYLTEALKKLHRQGIRPATEAELLREATDIYSGGTKSFPDAPYQAALRQLSQSGVIRISGRPPVYELSPPPQT